MFVKISRLHRELIAFFLIACVLSWSAMMLLWDVPKDTEGDNQKAVEEAFTRISFFYAFGPFLSAIAVSGLFRGRSGVKLLFKPLLRWRAGFIWYVCALFVPVMAHWMGFGLWCLLGGNGLNLPTFAGAVKTWLIATPLISVFIITEESGWRGFALPRLQSLRRALSASLVLGLFWSLWHWPLNVAIERASGGLAATVLLSLAIFTASTMLFSVLMTWVFNSSQGSLLLMLLMHGSNNASFFIVMGAMGQDGDIDLSFGISYMLALLFLVSLVLIRYGTKSISKSDRIVFES